MLTKQWIAGLAFSLIAANAQTASQSAYRGQSWVGLLVPTACEKGKSQADHRSKSTRDADLTVSGRTTTPAVDGAGTRGSATASETGATKQSVPETGDVLANGKSSGDPGWGAAHKQAQSLGESCSLSASTAQFALLLPDGTKLQFDELANQSIAKQLSLPSTGGKVVLRVSVQGKLQNGKIALDSIQM